MRTYTATEAKNELGKVLDGLKNGPAEIRKRNRPFAYVISADDFSAARWAIMRERLRRLISAKDAATLQFLNDFAQGKRSRLNVELGLELDSYGDLLQALAMAGLKAPQVPNTRRTTMRLDFQSALRSKAVRVVIADWGALISMAHSGHLSLLDTLHPNARFVTTDVVMSLVERRIDLAYGEVITEFFGRHRARLQIDRTRLVESLAQRGFPTTVLPTDYAEHSVVSYLPLLGPSLPGESTVVVIEDDWFLTHTIRPPMDSTWIATSALLDALIPTRIPRQPSGEPKRSTVQRPARRKRLKGNP